MGCWSLASGHWLLAIGSALLLYELRNLRKIWLEKRNRLRMESDLGDGLFNYDLFDQRQDARDQ